MVKNNKKVAFFYPTKAIGGAQLLFARLAVELSDYFTIIIIDLKGGYISEYVKTRNINFEFINYKQNKISKINKNICLIQPLSAYPLLNKKLVLTEESTILFWSIHPHNIFTYFRYTPIYTRLNYKWSNLISTILELKRKNKIKNFLEEALVNKSLFYMDEANERPSIVLDLIKTKTEYLPIPILDNTQKKLTHTNPNKLNIAWIGRITDEKVKPFNYIINRLEKSKYTKKINFHIIGYGDKSILKSIKYLNVLDHGIINSEDLPNFLVKNVDAVFAMGTSVLESAILGIPSILTDVSKKKMPPNYKYKWLFESDNYNLGSDAHYSNGKHEIETILKDLFDEELWLALANKCRDYSLKNHGIKNVVSQLTEVINQSSLSLKICKKYTF